MRDAFLVETVFFQLSPSLLATRAWEYPANETAERKPLLDSPDSPCLLATALAQFPTGRKVSESRLFPRRVSASEAATSRRHREQLLGGVQQAPSVRGRAVNAFSPAGHAASITSQLCCGANGHGCVQIRPHLQNRQKLGSGWRVVRGLSLTVSVRGPQMPGRTRTLTEAPVPTNPRQ